MATSDPLFRTREGKESAAVGSTRDNGFLCDPHYWIFTAGHVNRAKPISGACVMERSVLTVQA